MLRYKLRGYIYGDAADFRGRGLIETLPQGCVLSNYWSRARQALVALSHWTHWLRVRSYWM